MIQSNQANIKIVVIRLIAAFILALTTVGILYFRLIDDLLYTVQVFPPTCTENGYTLRINKKSGSSHITKVIPANGHAFGASDIIRFGDAVQPDIYVHRCTICGTEEQYASYKDSTLPRISLYGSLDGISKTSEVSLQVDFSGYGQSFYGYAALQFQGHDSLKYPKKNYTIQFYEDRDHTTKNKRTFSHWNPEHKFILKANYNDPSHCRNIICSNIWAEIVQTRERVPHKLVSLSNYGATDGFPTAVYLNDEFHGLFTLTLHKDDDLFGMEKEKNHALMILNAAKTDEAYFRAGTSFALGSPWEIEFCGTEDTEWVKEQLNTLIDFVINSNDDAFRKELNQYLDLDSAVDYLIAMYALGLPTHAAEDLLLVSYGRNKAWICSHYDMHDSFQSGESGEFLPQKNGEEWDSCTDSLLWDRLLNTYFSEICQRYTRLRKNVLVPEKIISAIETYTSQIPKEIYEAEAAVNGTAPFTETMTAEMKTFIENQIAQLDIVFSEGSTKK